MKEVKIAVNNERYILMSFVMDRRSRCYAIIYRDIKYPDYVVACGYNTKDGTWDAGIYCSTYEGALEELKARI